ncbi:MAG: metallophosphoesterase [Bacteroidales bacterium]|nr:metallophosphoesterase [Bacteroidales bacterium]
MTLQYASDLHCEFPANRDWLLSHGLRPSADILVLAGDIEYLERSKKMGNAYFDWLNEHFRQVYIVPGNHEYYSGIELSRTLSEFDHKVRDNVHYVNNKSIVVGDTELFFTTLWTKVSPGFVADLQYGMMDTRYICYKRYLLFAREYNEIHARCAKWLKEAVETSNAKHKVIVTHHCPTFNPAYNGHPGSRLNCGFLIDMEEFIQNHPDIDYWIFGHTHYNGSDKILADGGLTIGHTRLVTNQLGYVHCNEMNGFNPSAVIVLPD